MTGPASGGTEIDAGLKDFSMSNERSPNSFCIFPGYEDISTGVVEQGSLGYVAGLWVSGVKVVCTTPALNVTDVALASGTMQVFEMFTLVEVGVNFLGRSTPTSF